MPNNLTDQAYSKIIQRIINLDYVPGQKISEKNIEQDLGIGRTPVREAILRVKQGGLITVVPQSGTYVSLIELNRVNDALFSRRNLEAAVLKEACKTDFSQITKNRLFHLHYELEEAAKEHDIYSFFSFFDQLHKSYYTNSNHEMIWAWIQNINMYFYRIIVLNLKANQVSWQKVVEDEKAVLDAIINKDEAKIPDLLDEEMNFSMKREQGLIDSYPEYFDLQKN